MSNDSLVRRRHERREQRRELATLWLTYYDDPGGNYSGSKTNSASVARGPGVALKKPANRDSQQRRSLLRSMTRIDSSEQVLRRTVRR